MSTLPTILEDNGKSNTKLKSNDPTGSGKVEISRELTQIIIPKTIREKYHNLYHYINQSLSFQQNKITLFGHTNDPLGIINCDFHHIQSKQPLYCVIKRSSTASDKDWYMIHQLFTAKELIHTFNIRSQQIPTSWRNDTYFRTQINSIQCIDNISDQLQRIINDTKWNTVIINKKIRNVESVQLSMSKLQFKNKLLQYTDNIGNPILIPILRMNTTQQQWIEHVWMVQIRDNIHIGISLQIALNTQHLRVCGIHLDAQYMLHFHELVDINTHNDAECHCLDHFVSNIDSLYIGNMDNTLKQLKRKNKTMREKTKKYQAFTQKVVHILKDSKQDELLNEALSLLNENKGMQLVESKQRTNDVYMTNAGSNPLVLMQYPFDINMQQYIAIPYYNIPYYNHKPIIRSIVAGNVYISDIFISKTCTKRYLKHIAQSFANSNMLFYYLTNSITLQINDGFAKIYNDEWIIIDCDLNDKMGHKLYGVIGANTMKKRKKFKWELIQLCDEMGIARQYNIDTYDLPYSSRDNTSFVGQLELTPQIQTSLRRNVNIGCIRCVKNKSISISMGKQIVVTATKDEIKQCLMESLERNDDGYGCAIPIVKIKDNKHWIEWIIICEYDDMNMIGISFKFVNDNCDEMKATSVFLHKKDILRQHMLCDASVSVQSKCLHEFKSGISKLIIT